MRDAGPVRHDPATADWPLIAAFASREQRLGRWAERHGPLCSGLYQLFRLGVRQALACLFGGTLLLFIAATRLWYPQAAALPRYDTLVLACLMLQVLFWVLRFETLAEVQVISVFHVVRTAMELFKTAVGSWTYPEASYLRIGAVPLFTGFMYGAVGSDIARVWRLFDFRIPAR